MLFIYSKSYSRNAEFNNLKRSRCRRENTILAAFSPLLNCDSKNSLSSSVSLAFLLRAIDRVRKYHLCLISLPSLFPTYEAFIPLTGVHWVSEIGSLYLSPFDFPLSPQQLSLLDASEFSLIPSFTGSTAKLNHSFQKQRGLFKNKLEQSRFGSRPLHAL